MSTFLREPVLADHIYRQKNRHSRCMFLSLPSALHGLGPIEEQACLVADRVILPAHEVKLPSSSQAA